MLLSVKLSLNREGEDKEGENMEEWKVERAERIDKRKVREDRKKMGKWENENV